MNIPKRKITNNSKTRKIFFDYLIHYMDENDANFLLNLNKYKKTIHDFIFWFEESKLLKIDQNDSPLIASQKISIEIVILISLIHSVENNYSEECVKRFFSKLTIEEKFLLGWIVEIESPWKNFSRVINEKQKYEKYWLKKEKDRKKQKRMLIEDLINNGSLGLIESNFEEIVKYLFALRSQIVHRGDMCFSAKFILQIPKFITSAIVEKYPLKNVKRKTIHFADCHDLFDSILKELFFSALLKKVRPNRKKISSKIRANLEYIIRDLEKNNFDIIDYKTKGKLREKIKSI